MRKIFVIILLVLIVVALIAGLIAPALREPVYQDDLRNNPRKVVQND